jgi:hypothetical protein
MNETKRRNDVSQGSQILVCVFVDAARGQRSYKIISKTNVGYHFVARA